jgi:hypothetical protein
MPKIIIAVVSNSSTKALLKCRDLNDLLTQLRQRAVTHTGQPLGQITFQIKKNSDFFHVFKKLIPSYGFSHELVDRVCLRKHEFYLVIDDTKTHIKLKQDKNKKVCFYSTDWATY